MLDSGTTLTYLPWILYKKILNLIINKLNDDFAYVKSSDIIIV